MHVFICVHSVQHRILQRLTPHILSWIMFQGDLQISPQMYMWLIICRKRPEILIVVKYCFMAVLSIWN